MTKDLDSGFGPEDVNLIGRQTVYQGFVRVDKSRLRHRKFNGSWSEPIDREIVCKHDAVGILVYDPSLDSVCLVQQFRAPLMGRLESPWILELVAGLIDKQGESEEQVARRELMEEAGIAPGYLCKINEYWMSPGASTEKMHLFVALAPLAEVEGVYGLASESEDIRALVVPRATANSWAFERMEANASSLIALQWLNVNLSELKQQWAACQI